MTHSRARRGMGEARDRGSVGNRRDSSARPGSGHPEKTRRVELSGDGRRAISSAATGAAHDRSDPGEGRAQGLLLPALAVAAVHEAGSAVHEGVDGPRSERGKGREGIDRRPKTGSPWLGRLFRTGSATRKVNRLDTHVWQRLQVFIGRRKGRHHHAGETEGRTRAFFHARGLRRPSGNFETPRTSCMSPLQILNRKPFAQTPHAWCERAFWPAPCDSGVA